MDESQHFDQLITTNSLSQANDMLQLPSTKQEISGIKDDGEHSNLLNISPLQMSWQATVCARTTQQHQRGFFISILSRHTKKRIKNHAAIAQTSAEYLYIYF